MFVVKHPLFRQAPEGSESAAKGVVETLKAPESKEAQAAAKVRHILNELKGTEKSYVEGMRQLEDLYFLIDPSKPAPSKALKDASEKIMKTPQGQALVGLLKQSQQILKVHEEVHRQLQDPNAFDTSKPDESAKKVNELMGYLKGVKNAYVKYSEYYNEVVPSGSAQSPGMKQLTEAFGVLGNKPQLLSAYMILPIQRLPRYEMLTKDLSKTMTTAGMAATEAASAADISKQTASYLNQKLKDDTNFAISLTDEKFQPYAQMHELLSKLSDGNNEKFKGILDKVISQYEKMNPSQTDSENIKDIKNMNLSDFTKVAGMKKEDRAKFDQRCVNLIHALNITAPTMKDLPKPLKKDILKSSNLVINVAQTVASAFGYKGSKSYELYKAANNSLAQRSLEMPKVEKAKDLAGFFSKTMKLVDELISGEPSKIADAKIPKGNSSTGQTSTSAEGPSKPKSQEDLAQMLNTPDPKNVAQQQATSTSDPISKSFEAETSKTNEKRNSETLDPDLAARRREALGKMPPRDWNAGVKGREALNTQGKGSTSVASNPQSSSGSDPKKSEGQGKGQEQSQKTRRKP